MKSEEGSIYILVISIIFLTLAIYSTAYYTSTTQMKSTKVTVENDSMYYMAYSGLEKAEMFVNGYFITEKENIVNETIEYINSLPNKNIGYYSNYNSENEYLGDFHLKNDDLFKETFKTNAKNKIDKKLFGNGTLGVTSKYELGFDSELGDGHDSSYNVKVTLYYDNNGIKITSAAKNKKTNNIYKLDAKLIFSFDKSDEIFLEEIIPNEISNDFTQKIYAEEVIINEEDFSSEYKNDFESNSVLSKLFLLEDRDFEPNNPVIVKNESFEINVSDFNTSEEIIPIFIINKNPDSNTTIKSSANEKSIDGIIISAGNILIEEDTIFNGIIISNKKVEIIGNTNKSLNFYKANIFDKELRRKISDLIGITNFNNIGKQKEYNIENFSNCEIKIKSLMVNGLGKYSLSF